jgi:hypothetical protein
MDGFINACGAQVLCCAGYALCIGALLKHLGSFFDSEEGQVVISEANAGYPGSMDHHLETPQVIFMSICMSYKYMRQVINEPVNYDAYGQPIRAVSGSLPAVNYCLYYHRAISRNSKCNNRLQVISSYTM